MRRFDFNLFYGGGGGGGGGGGTSDGTSDSSGGFGGGLGGIAQAVTSALGIGPGVSQNTTNTGTTSIAQGDVGRGFNVAPAPGLSSPNVGYGNVGYGGGVSPSGPGTGRGGPSNFGSGLGFGLGQTGRGDPSAVQSNTVQSLLRGNTGTGSVGGPQQVAGAGGVPGPGIFAGVSPDVQRGIMNALNQSGRGRGGIGSDAVRGGTASADQGVSPAMTPDVRTALIQQLGRGAPNAFGPTGAQSPTNVNTDLSAIADARARGFSPTPIGGTAVPGGSGPAPSPAFAQAPFRGAPQQGPSGPAPSPAFGSGGSLGGGLNTNNTPVAPNVIQQIMAALQQQGGSGRYGSPQGGGPLPVSPYQGRG